MLHLFQSVAFPLGMVRVSEQGPITQYDTEIVPYDYTIYTSIMCSESLRFYFTTYENQCIQCVDLNHLMASPKKVQFDFSRQADFHLLTSDPNSFSK